MLVCSPAAFDGTAVTLMGHGVGDFGIILPALMPFWYSTNAGYFTGTTMTTEACRASYATAPNYHTRYDEQLIEDEMICIQAVGGPLNYQACEVRLGRVVRKVKEKQLARKARIASEVRLVS